MREKLILHFNDEELKSIYMVLCTLDFLPAPQWELKSKIERYLSNTLTLKEMKALSDESTLLLSNVTDKTKR